MSNAPDERITDTPRPGVLGTRAAHDLEHLGGLGPALARVGCLLAGCVGLVGGCSGLNHPDRAPTAAGLYLVAAAFAFGLLALAGRRNAPGPGPELPTPHRGRPAP